MRELVEVIAKSLVDYPDEVVVTQNETEKAIVIELRVAQSDMGKVIGKQGRKLKGVGKSAREEIEALLGTKVFLELWVKVKENWRDSDFALSNFGYKE